MDQPILKSCNTGVPDIPDILISQDEFSIGRSRTSTYVFAEIQLSRKHCFFKRMGDKWTVTDYSTNGVLLNGKLIEKNNPVEIENGAMLALNENIKFTFCLPDTRHDQLAPANSVPSIEKVTEIQMGNNSETAQSSTRNEKTQNDKVGNTNVTENVVATVDQTSATADIEPIENLIQSKDSTSVTPTASDDSSKSQSTEIQVVEKEIAAPSSEVSFPQLVEDEFHCVICSELFIKAVTLNCSHTFCKHCISEWKRHHKQCPICRSRIISETSTLVLDSFINRMVKKMSESEQQLRKDLIAAREKLESTEKSKRPDTVILDDTLNMDSESGETTDDSFSDYSEQSIMDYDNDDEWESEYSGLPGAYYGGYGHCYSCGATGHWANGCPSRLRR